MDMEPRPIKEQTIVITGASSGIGMTTAQFAAEHGANVLLVARSESKLDQIVRDLREGGHRADYAVCDVADADAVEAAARKAVEVFGAIDTWINCAAQTIYGRVDEVDPAEARRIFEVNYFGMLHGCLAALPRLRDRGCGAIINVASAVADRTIPLQGHYCATKAAIQSLTDALRMELEHDGEPIAVTLIKPGSVDTPFAHHARNYLADEPSYPPPVYTPEVVARAILDCIVEPKRDVLVGGGAKMISASRNTPRLTDRYMERKLFDQQHSGRPRTNGRGNLFEPMADEPPSRTGGYQGTVHDSSLYTRSVLHPVLGLMGAGLGAGAEFVVEGSMRGVDGEEPAD